MALPTTGITSVDDSSDIFQGDTREPFAPQFWMWDEDLRQYAPMDLTGLTITMKMVNATGVIKDCSGAFTIDDASQGKAHRQYNPEDVDTVGVWTRYVKLTDTSGAYVHAETTTLNVKYAP